MADFFFLTICIHKGEEKKVVGQFDAYMCKYTCCKGGIQFVGIQKGREKSCYCPRQSCSSGGTAHVFKEVKES